MEQSKAHVGGVTRKFVDNGTASSTKAAGYSYSLPMTECKSFIEIDGGEIISEEDHAAMLEIIKLMTTQLQTIKTAVN